MRNGVLTAATLAVALTLGSGGWSRAAGIPDRIDFEKPGDRQIVEFDVAVKETAADSDCVRLEGVGDTKLIVTAAKKGRAAVTYVLRDGRTGQIAVTVVPDDQLGAVEAYLKRQLADVVGVEVARNKEGLPLVEVSGTVRVPKDCVMVRRVVDDAAKRWGQTVANNVRIEPDTSVIKQVFLQGLVGEKVENPQVEVAADASRISVAGTVYTEAQKAEAVRLLDALAKKLDLGDVTIAAGGLTLAGATFDVEVTYFELSDTQGEQIGADLLRQVHMEGTASYGTGQKPNYTLAADINLDKVLQEFQSCGVVKTLKHFTVTTQNGKEGESQSGQTIVTPVTTQAGASPVGTAATEAGDIVRATPAFKDAGTVHLDIDAQVSVITDVSQTGNISITKRAAKSSLDLPLESQVVLGVNQSTSSAETRSGTPWVSKVPVLSWFFGSKTSTDAKGYAGFRVAVRRIGATVVESPSVSTKTDEIIRQIRERMGKGQ